MGTDDNIARYMTVAEVAARFRASRAAVIRWCTTGMIDAIQTPGGRWLIRATAVSRIEQAGLEDTP